MIVPAEKQQEVIALAKATAESMVMGDAFAPGVYLGPMIDQDQQQSVRKYILTGIREGPLWSPAVRSNPIIFPKDILSSRPSLPMSSRI